MQLLFENFFRQQELSRKELKEIMGGAHARNCHSDADCKDHLLGHCRKNICAYEARGESCPAGTELCGCKTEGGHTNWCLENRLEDCITICY